VQIAVYVTDGAANEDVELTIPYAVEAHNDGILILGVSLGFDADTSLLSAIVTRPPEAHLFLLVSSRQLGGYVDRVVNASCNSFDACAADPHPCQSGGRCVDRVSMSINQSIKLFRWPKFR